jgi:WASH complex subunit 7
MFLTMLFVLWSTFNYFVPLLTLSYIERISILKDKVLKQNKNTSFSDDGFPMGLAYISRLLTQDAHFDSLHWFDSLKIQAQFESEEAQTAASRKNAIERTKTIKFALQLIDRKINEYDLSETTIHSARILFN